MAEEKEENTQNDVKTYAFIDASNLFYGGEKSLGWKIDYKKLLAYLKEKYNVSKTFYFGGVETHNFQYDYIKDDTVSINELMEYLVNLVKNKNDSLTDTDILLIGRHLKRIKFYKKLDDFGYKLLLKPVKTYEQEDGYRKRKANVDADMAFYLMKEKENFDKVVVLSGDGDFLSVLKYLQNEESKELIILSRGPRTAKEIRQLAGGNFRDFVRIQHKVQFEEVKK